MAMVAKLWNERERKWLLISDVTKAEHYTGRYILRKEAQPGTNALVTELLEQNPEPEGWKPNQLYLAELLIPLSLDDRKNGRSFKVVGLFIDKPDGSEIYRCYGFTSGYMLNGEGKTVEKL